MWASKTLYMFSACSSRHVLAGKYGMLGFGLGDSVATMPLRLMEAAHPLQRTIGTEGKVHYSTLTVCRVM